MSIIPHVQFLEVSDLGLASYLQCSGFSALKLDRTNPRRVVFCFERGDAIEKVARGYWERTARVDPLSLLLSHKTLKQRIYNEQP